MAVLPLAEDEAGDLLDEGLLLVRPDQVIAWRGANVPENAAAIWARVARA